MPASTIVIPSPLVGEGQGEGGGVSRLNTELPAFTLIPAFCLRGPPSREKGQKQSMPASTIRSAERRVGKGRGEGARRSRLNTELCAAPTFQPAPVEGAGAKVVQYG